MRLKIQRNPREEIPSHRFETLLAQTVAELGTSGIIFLGALYILNLTFPFLKNYLVTILIK